VKPGQSVALARSFRSMGDLVRQRLERLDERSAHAREGLVVGYLSRAASLLAEQPDEARRLYEDAQVLAERALEAAPGEPSQLEALSTIYHVLMRLDGREGVEAAARWGRRLVEVYEQLAFLYDGERGALQHLAAAHNQLGDLLEGDEPYEAWGCYARAKELREALVAATPDDFGVLQALANSLHRLGRLDARLDPLRAKGWFQQEVAACARLVGLRPGDDDLLRNLSVAYYRLAELLQDEDPREARALFEKDAALSRELVKRAPSDVQRLKDLLSSYQKLYELRVSDSDDNLAELAELEMEAVQQLGAAAPQDPALRRHALRLLKHMDEREPSLAPARQARWMRQQVELVEGLLEREPGDAELRERFARACRRLGELHLVSKPEAARTWLVRGLEALERLPAGEPGNHLEQAAYFYKALARLEEEEHPSSASVWLQQFVDAVEQLLDRHGENPALVWDLAETCDKLGKMRADRTPREAAQWFTRAMNARNRLLAFHSAPGAMFQAYETRRNPLGHTSKGWAQLQGWLQGAQETLERLLVLDRQNPSHQRDLAVCHLLLGDIEAKRGIEPEARRLYELGVSRLNRQVSLFPKNPRLLTDAGHAYARLEDLERGKDPERAKHWALLQAETQKRLEALYAEALNPGPRGS
jgi:tetratricopeptide (TPR) repeat protein